MGTNPTFVFENNYLILRLRKPLKTSTRLAGHGIWTRDLPNASLVRYHGATSLGSSCFVTLVWQNTSCYANCLHLFVPLYSILLTCSILKHTCGTILDRRSRRELREFLPVRNCQGHSRSGHCEWGVRLDPEGCRGCVAIWESRVWTAISWDFSDRGWMGLHSPSTEGEPSSWYRILLQAFCLVSLSRLGSGKHNFTLLICVFRHSLSRIIFIVSVNNTHRTATRTKINTCQYPHKFLKNFLRIFPS